MISTDKYQKIGKLASDLLAHGMAKDTLEATKLAEQMLTKSQSFTPEGNMNPHPNQPAQQSNWSSQQQAASPETAKEIEDLKFMVRKINYAFDEQTKQMNEIIAYIKKVEDDLKNVKNTVNAPKPRTMILEKEREVPQTHLQKEEQKSHPRSGDWKPGDVLIEKMFYAGPKKG